MAQLLTFRCAAPNSTPFRAVSKTDAAVSRVQELLSKKRDDEPRPIGVRVGVKTKGCSGLAYTLNYAYEPLDAMEERVEKDGVLVVVDRNAWQVTGSVMDFVRDEIREEFVFANPNATDQCGCGESWRIDEETARKLQEFKRREAEERAQEMER